MTNNQSNNPPDVTLELTKDQADFLMRNCDSNIAMALEMLQTQSEFLPRASLESIVVVTEQFKEIRTKLLAQGIKSK